MTQMSHIQKDELIKELVEALKISLKNINEALSVKPVQMLGVGLPLLNAQEIIEQALAKVKASQ